MTMPDLWTFTSASTVDLLGWTLLHFVWQGTLLAAVVAGALYLLRNHTPRVRYAVSCVALLGLLALPVGTGLFLSEQVLSGRGPSVTEGSAAPVVVETAEEPALSQSPEAKSAAPGLSFWPERASAWVRPALPWLVLGWGVGVLLFAVRLAGGAWHVRRLRRTSTPASSEWQERLRELAGQMGLRRSVALHRSERVESPVVAGWWRPVVLVPAGLLSALPPDQVEALLLHELAHVRRHDVLVGRLQAVVETLLFFHPATWWISKQVRQTREACCDDLAVRAGPDRTVYARALTAMAERAVAGSTAAWAPAASDGSLLVRIRRLLSPADASTKHTQRLSLAAAVLLLVGVPLGLAACVSQESTQLEQKETTQKAANFDDSGEGGENAFKYFAEGTYAWKYDGDTVAVDRSQLEPGDTSMVVLPGGGVDGVESLGNGRYVWRRGREVDTVGPTQVETGHGVITVRPGRRGNSWGKASELEDLEIELLSDSSLVRRYDGVVDTLARSQRPVRHLNDSILVVRRDGHADTIDYSRPKIEPLDGGGYVMHRDGETDTLNYSHPEIDPLGDGVHVVRHNGEVDTLGRGGPKIERLDDGTLVMRHDGRVDTLHRSHLPEEWDPDLDSLRRHLEQMQERMKQEVPERLREQARRLREQAERLEERAEEMETPDPSEVPETPEPDSTNGTDEMDSSPFLLKDLQATIDGQTTVDGGVSLRGDGYIWIRGPEAVYVFSAHSFDGAHRIGTFRGRSLTATINGHDVTIRSAANRPIYATEGAPMYADRIALSVVGEDVGSAGVGSRLSSVKSDLRRLSDRQR